MNLNAKRGDKVRFRGFGGQSGDLKFALSALTPGAVYTVSRMSVWGWISWVEFATMPDRWFNTVLFDDIESPTKGANDKDYLNRMVGELTAELEMEKKELADARLLLDCHRAHARRVEDGWRAELEAAKHAESVAENEVVILQKELVETNKQLAANRYGVANEVYDLRTQLANAHQDLKQQIRDLNVGNKRLHDELEAAELTGHQHRVGRAVGRMPQHD